MANPEHVKLVRKGARAVNRRRQARSSEYLDLSGANLGGIDLAEGNLREVDLRGANLAGADLSGANLDRGNLSDTNLQDANFFTWQAYSDDALLTGRALEATLRFANLCGADLRGACLVGANLHGSRLDGADLSGALIGGTVLTGVDMSTVIGLSEVKHDFWSSIGVDTLMASFRPAGDKPAAELTAFFLGAAVPEELLKEMPRILDGVRSCACFISYGQPDVAFATELRQELGARGVSCWLYDMDKTPGEQTWSEIGVRRREADKMIVLCSAAALVRPGVRKEIEEQIDEDQTKLIPISLDDLWREKGFVVERDGRDLKPFLLGRNYVDFVNKPHEEALQELLRGLRRARTVTPTDAT